MSPFDEQLVNELKELEPKLISYLKTPNVPTNNIIAHIIQSGGKRVRPGLFLLCCDLLGYQDEHRHPIAAVCEYIHTASLLHDDVIDNSPQRRGKPTVGSLWGDETAVLAGDLIYSAACRLMVKTGSLELIDTFAECIRFMSESELYQLQLLWKIDTTTDECLRVVEGKTAYLFGAACQTPAFLAQQSKDTSDALFAFGTSLGFCFQIADDCLDYAPESGTLGKPALSDAFEGKVTLPLILALRTLSGTGRNFIEAILSGNEPRTEENQRALQDLVVSHGGVSQALEYADKRAADSFAALERLTNKQNNIDVRVLEKLADVLRYTSSRKK